MSDWAWIVFSVTGEKGTGMKALSWEADWMSLPLFLAATILLVPTSRPIGFEPALTRLSMRSCASSATFQRCSLFSGISPPFLS